ncbi:MAG TPA: hypothetical protein VF476_04050 [Chitinophagaceae bacterium]
MRKTYSIAASILIIAASVFMLTAGISKDSRYGGGRDMVEELYDLSVKQSDNLKSIEDGIGKFYRKRDESLEKYNFFTNQNSQYYTDARAKAATIADAAVKQKATDLINKSETRYLAKLTDWKNHIATLNTKERELKDLHALLKIMSSEPMIEKYQNASFPDNGKLKETNSDLQQLIEKIKAITN